MKGSLRLSVLDAQIRPGLLAGGDTTAPSCTLTTAASATVYAAFSVTATFSEDVTGFVVGDITVTNGSAGSFVAVSASVYTFTVTPDGGALTVTVGVGADVCTDAAGNGNSAATNLTRESLILPTANAVFLWDARTGAYSDTGLTTPSTDGGIVRGVKDDFGNGHDVTQSGASTICPVWRQTVASFNNQPAFEFDGGDYLFKTLASPVIGNLTTYTIYIVWRSNQSGAGEKVFMGDSSSAGNTPRVTAVHSTNNGQVRHFHADGAAFTSYIGNAKTLNDNTARLLTIRRVTNDFELRSQTWTDNEQTVIIGATATNRLSLGAWIAAAVQAYFTGQIAMVAVYSADNYATVEPIIQSIYGICDTYYNNVADWYFTIGDSKTIGWVDPTLACGGFGFQPLLDAKLTTATGNTWRSIKPRAAHGGYDCAAIKAEIDADLAAVDASQVPSWVLVNIGANDVDSLPTQASFESNLGYILDAVNTKWSSANVRVMYVWRRTFGANCDTLAGWIDNVLATRSAWAAAGPDERIFIENGDDGATYTDDGIHPNQAGNDLTADQWQSAMGY